MLFRRLAEIAGQSLKKGSQIYATGRIQTRKWIDSTGIERFMTEIVVNDMQMLDRRHRDGVKSRRHARLAARPHGIEDCAARPGATTRSTACRRRGGRLRLR